MSPNKSFRRNAALRGLASNPTMKLEDDELETKPLRLFILGSREIKRIYRHQNMIVCPIWNEETMSFTPTAFHRFRGAGLAISNKKILRLNRCSDVNDIFHIQILYSTFCVCQIDGNGLTFKLFNPR